MRIWTYFVLLYALGLVIGLAQMRVLAPDLAGDASQYVASARALVGQPGELFYYRSLGYPFFLILTGFPWHESGVIVQLAQVALGASIPILTGLTMLRLQARTWACVLSATFTFATLTPFVLATSILTDQTSLFLAYLFLFIFSRYLDNERHPPPENEKPTRWIRRAAAPAATLFVLSLVRPANVFTGAVTLGFAFIFGSKGFRKAILAVLALLIVGLAAWVPAQRIVLHAAEEMAGRTFAEARGELSGVMYFWNVYGSGSTFVGKPIVLKTNGPCTTRLAVAIDRKISSLVPPPANVDTLLASPTLLNHYVMWKAAESDLGAEEMNALFWCSAFEAQRLEPKSLVYYFDGLVSWFFNSDVIYNSGFRAAWPSSTAYSGTVVHSIGVWALYVGTAMKVIATILALVLGGNTWKHSPLRRTFLVTAWGAILSTALVHIVFAAPHWRYTLVWIPLLGMLAILGLDSSMHSSSKAKRIPQDDVFSSSSKPYPVEKD